MDKCRKLLLLFNGFTTKQQSMSAYLHDTGERNDQDVGTREVSDDGVDTRGSSTVDPQPDADQHAANSAEPNLDVEDY